MRATNVIRRYTVIAGLYTLSASLIWGVNTLFLLDAGLDLLGVFIANAAFTAGMVAFELPTGVLADTAGRRASFLLSLAVLFIGTLGYVAVARLGMGLLAFSAVSIVLGLGYTFYSGAVEAWVVDALQTSGYTGELDGVFARDSLVTGLAMLLGTVGGGLLGQADLAFPYLLRMALLAIVFGYAWFTMHDLGFAPQPFQLREFPARLRTLTRQSIAFGWRDAGVRPLMLVSALTMGFLTWGFYAWQPYFLDLLGRQDAVWLAGVLAALISLATMLGNGLVERLTRFCGRRTTLLIGGAGVFAAASVGVGLAGTFAVAVALFLLSHVAMGVLTPVRQAYLHDRTASDQRATVVSFDSMLGSGGGVLGQSGLGYLAQTRAIASGYVAGGLAMLLTLPILWRLRRLQQDQDRIVGVAGRGIACAAQGLPETTAVNLTLRGLSDLDG